PIPDPKDPPHILVIGEVVKGKFDPSFGEYGKQALADYVKGLLAIGADRIALMRYCFDYLDHEDAAIATDAYRQFITSTDPDIRAAARKLSAVKLRRWLQDPRT